MDDAVSYRYSDMSLDADLELVLCTPEYIRCVQAVILFRSGLKTLFTAPFAFCSVIYFLIDLFNV